MRALRGALLPALLSVVAACGGASPSGSPIPAAPVATVDPASAGRVSGRVRFDGPVPDAGALRIDGDRSCASLNGTDRVADESIAVGAGGGLRNVFVYVRTGLEQMRFPIPNEPVVVDQQKCQYTPRVVGVRVGQPFEIRNGDPLLHNVRADSAINQPFNQGQPVQGMAFTRTFTTREVMVPVKCDVHAWMRAYVGALEHPYFAVTGSDGAFTLPDLPPGTYTVEAWHERLGTREQQVTIAAKESKDVDFTFAR